MPFKLITAHDSQTRALLENTLEPKTVINLSHVILSDRQKEILELGLQFIPTPVNIDGMAIQKAVNGFSRQMHLRYFFRGTKNSREIEKFTNKSTWDPPLKNEEIVGELEHLQDQVMSTTRLVNHTPNMTKKQLESIRTLKENKDIIIKPADKGVSSGSHVLRQLCTGGRETISEQPTLYPISGIYSPNSGNQDIICAK